MCLVKPHSEITRMCENLYLHLCKSKFLLQWIAVENLKINNRKIKPKGSQVHWKAFVYVFWSFLFLSIAIYGKSYDFTGLMTFGWLGEVVPKISFRLLVVSSSHLVSPIPQLCGSSRMVFPFPRALWSWQCSLTVAEEVLASLWSQWSQGGRESRALLVLPSLLPQAQPPSFPRV